LIKLPFFLLSSTLVIDGLMDGYTGRHHTFLNYLANRVPVKKENNLEDRV